jgi:hypothetical protein
VISERPPTPRRLPLFPVDDLNILGELFRELGSFLGYVGLIGEVFKRLSLIELLTPIIMVSEPMATSCLLLKSSYQSFT